MRVCIPDSPRCGSSGFRQVVSAFLGGAKLPFADVLSAERIERTFAKHGGLFGFGGVYSTAIVVWSFLGQVLRDGKQASCQSAVAGVASYCQQAGREPPTSDTGDYCRARAKLSDAALRELSGETANALEQRADEAWLWKGKHAKLVDGFTFTMPDTAKNQAEFPQQRAQTAGVGLPIARAVAVLSLATACALDAAIGPYKGKETGESALLRSLLQSFRQDDVAVFDRYYCSFMTIALLQWQGTQVCARLHHRRKCDFRRGRRLGKCDHLVAWTKPDRPAWMDEATYALIPDALEMRELRYRVVEKGRRTKTITVATTLTDADQYSAEDVAQLYGFRWNAELDIRSVKDSLNLGHVRCKSPHMVRCELWTTLLAYNLIRATAAGAALLHEKQPRQISFAGACQYVLSAWMLLSCERIEAASLCEFCRALAAQIANCEVANRPGRLEPRVLKRRRHRYKLMRKPRKVLRQELQKKCT